MVSAAIKDLLKQVTGVYLTLLKVMVPTIVLVKILDLLGGTLWLSTLLSPFMKFVGLPEQMGIIWATAILTNIYTAMIVFVDVTASMQLSVAQVSVMGILILLSHSIPMEGAVAKMVGVSWRLTISLKLGGGLLLAALVNYLYSELDYQQQPAVLLWQSEQLEQSLWQWAVDQLLLLGSIFFIILALMILLRFLRLIGVEKLMQLALSPLFKLLNITKDASNITIIGITLGLSFGAGLLIAEIKSGSISKRDVLLSISLLSLAHSLIEDTLLILLLGADVTAILWLRIVFSVIVVAMMSQYLGRGSSKALTGEV
ncbi:MAG: hypothetical protein MJK10_12660 [Pseudomonadales bacterium]|nr:hypothetical protein [Pseudomonadales bacterium]NRA16858.1 hypothetical protein [Oceanospirillaceae bacterium]